MQTKDNRRLSNYLFGTRGNFDFYSATQINILSICFWMLLQEAKETLCDPEKRAVYDKWRNSGISMSYKQWLGMKEHVGQVRRYTIAEKVDKEVCVRIRNTARKIQNTKLKQRSKLQAPKNSTLLCSEKMSRTWKKTQFCLFIQLLNSWLIRNQY